MYFFFFFLIGSSALRILEMIYESDNNIKDGWQSIDQSIQQSVNPSSIRGRRMSDIVLPGSPSKAHRSSCHR